MTGTFVYLEDIFIEAETWTEHMQRLSSLLQCLEETGLTIIQEKSSFGQGTVTFLRHVVGLGQTRPKEANIEAIIKFPKPKTSNIRR